MRKNTTDEFILKAKLAHGDLYDYSLTKYINSRTGVDVICKKHGIFNQSPRSHIRGHHCPRCGADTTNSKQRKPVNEFIKSANVIHKNKYDYSKVKYNNNKDKIIIICPIHGEFINSVNSHLVGRGCSKCSNSLKGYPYNKWEKAGLVSKNFESFKIYIVRCWDENESFFKIGKTYKSIKSRLGVGDYTIIPYKYELIHKIEGSARAISELELELHKYNAKYKYLPNKNFAGKHECFSEYKLIIY